MKSLKNIYHLFKDLYDLYFVTSDANIYKYAFIVHPRDLKDVYKKFPFLKYFGKKNTNWILSKLWPVTVSKITGLKDLKDKEVSGYIISIPIVAEQMLQDRKLAECKILEAVQLAKNKNCKIVGLGGLTSSLTAGGKTLQEKIDGIYITTGHAYTGYNVTKNVLELAKIYNMDFTKTKIAIVGATGSIGSISAQILAKSGFKNFLLVDVDKKKDRFQDVVDKMNSYGENLNIQISCNMLDVVNSDIVVTATNTKEALIKNEHVKSGMIIVDDAQPSDVSEEVLNRVDILTVEAGVVHTPGIFSNFNLGLKNRTDNFCCMAEVLCLASLKHQDHFVIHRATLEDVEEIVKMSKHLNFSLGKFQNKNKQFSEEEILQFKKYIID